MKFWLNLITTRIVLVLNRLSTKEAQLELLQDLDFYIKKLQREIQLGGKL